MALNWTSISGSFNDTLYNDLLKLEAPNATERLNGKLVSGNFTIGIGFDMIAGGLPVQTAVFTQLGLKALPPFNVRPTASGPAQTEFYFGKELLTAISTHKGATVTVANYSGSGGETA